MRDESTLHIYDPVWDAYMKFCQEVNSRVPVRKLWAQRKVSGYQARHLLRTALGSFHGKEIWTQPEFLRLPTAAFQEELGRVFLQALGGGTIREEVDCRQWLTQTQGPSWAQAGTWKTPSGDTDLALIHVLLENFLTTPDPNLFQVSQELD